MADTSNGPYIEPICLNTSQKPVSPVKKNLKRGPFTTQLPHNDLLSSVNVRLLQCCAGVNTNETKIQIEFSLINQ